MRALLDSPKQAVSKLQKYKVGALFMEPGTGKTSVAHALINSVPNIDYVLYLAPFQAINQPNYKETVPAEIDRCGGFKMLHDFIGIESLSSADSLYLEIRNKLKKAKNPFIICDESLKIKNSNAIRTKRIIDLGTLADYKLILNGTPISRNLLDLWAQMEFLSPKILKMPESQFKNTFCEYTTITKRIGYRTIQKEWINGYHNIDYLYQLIDPFVFEADLSIDAKVNHLQFDFKLLDEELKEHNAIKEKYLDDETMEAKNNNIFLEITQKMQHNYSLSPAKFEILDKLIEKYGYDKMAICAKYIDSQNELKSRYPKLRILSWQKNSFSLNLQQYNFILKWDKHWDYALHDQLLHRIYRIGQKYDCTVGELHGNVGLEKLMSENVEKKGRLLEEFKLKTIRECLKTI
jgi:SNF2 family DNA or RNA helicase